MVRSVRRSYERHHDQLPVECESFKLNPIHANVYLDIAPIPTSGIPIYNDANAEGVDAYIFESHTFDSCLGHVSPGPEGLYHCESGL